MSDDLGSAVMLRIDIKNRRETIRALSTVNDNANKEFKAASKKAAEIVVPEAKRLAPKLTGNIANKLKAGATLKGAFVQAGTPKSVPYSRPHLFGRYYSTTGNRLPGNPFIHKAAFNMKDKIVEAQENALKDLFADNGLNLKI